MIYRKIYDNGAIGGFTINIYDELFSYHTQADLSHFEDEINKDKLNEALIKRTVMHELGHVLGLGHVDSPDTAIMIGWNWTISSYNPMLLKEDIDYAKHFCNLK